MRRKRGNSAFVNSVADVLSSLGGVKISTCHPTEQTSGFGCHTFDAVLRINASHRRGVAAYLLRAFRACNGAESNPSVVGKPVFRT